MGKAEYLSDLNFLKTIDSLRQQTIYVKVTALNRFEQELSSIEGVVINGSISVNGSSAIRRTGSLTLSASVFQYNIMDIKSIIGIDKKIKLEVGIKNTTNQYTEYDIIWFPLGIFIISQPSITYNATAYTITISLKDKMVLLNGEVGGVIPTMTIFSPVQVEGTDEAVDVKIYDLIYSLVTNRGQIPESQVIIQDIDNYLKQVVQYNGETSVSLVVEEEGSPQYNFIELTNDTGEYKPKDNVGYKINNFTFPTGETLSCNAGDSVTSVLDKIKNKLGNYEYFFDIDGIFHFQEIKNYINEGSIFNDLTEALNDKYFYNVNSENKAIYSFDNNNLITAFQNTPQYSNIKNNIVIWGDISQKNYNTYYYQVAIDTPPACQLWYVTFGPEIEDFYYGKYKRVTSASLIYFNGAKPVRATDWRTELYLSCIQSGQITYYSEKLIEEWPKVYDIEKQQYRQYSTEVNSNKPSDRLTYFFDMIDPNAIKNLQIQALSVSNLGVRTKVITDENINCLVYPQPPQICFIQTGQGDSTAELRNECIARGWNYTQIYPKLYQKLIIGSGYNAAYDLARVAMHETVNYVENITITSIPIYHLEPNTRITVKCPEAQIDGDYLIQSISLPIGANGTMTLQCVKAIEKI